MQGSAFHDGPRPVRGEGALGGGLPLVPARTTAGTGSASARVPIITLPGDGRRGVWSRLSRTNPRPIALDDARRLHEAAL